MKPYYSHAGISLLLGDVRDCLRSLPAESAQCCITSPPYLGLRDYGVPGQIGLEATPDEYLAVMVEVFREVRRVMRPDATLWLNIGDSYASGGRGGSEHHNEKMGIKTASAQALGPKKAPAGYKDKDLLGIPWRLAFALQADGWYLRSDIIWAKPNPMPESVTDRPTKAHEYLFLLSKGPRYYYDAEAIAEPSINAGVVVRTNGNNGMDEGYDGHRTRDGFRRGVTVAATRNRRTVWTIATEAYPDAHFATFPTALVEPCVLAGTSEAGCCPECGRPWERVTQIHDPNNRLGKSMHNHKDDLQRGQRRENGALEAEGRPIKTTTGWRPSCKCGDAHRDGPRPPVPCTVLDPFVGSGTSMLVAKNLGRHGIGIDLSEDYLRMAANRLQQDVLPLMATAANPNAGSGG